MTQFIISNAADVEENPMCTYRICITQMSGDADAYKTVDFDFEYPDEAKAIEYFNIACAIKDLQVYGGYDSSDEVAAGLLEKGYEVDPDSDIISEICGWDVTCDYGRLAYVTAIEVFWFDVRGTKFNVVVN